MSQKQTPLDLGESSKQVGQGSDKTLNIPAPSIETELKEDTQSPLTETNIIKQLLIDFNGQYEQRWRCLELDTSVNREVLMQVSTPCFVKCYYCSEAV